MNVYYCRLIHVRRALPGRSINIWAFKNLCIKVWRDDKRRSLDDEWCGRKIQWSINRDRAKDFEIETWKSSHSSFMAVVRPSGLSIVKYKLLRLEKLCDETRKPSCFESTTVRNGYGYRQGQSRCQSQGNNIARECLIKVLRGEATPSR
ncbi:unnamed protein product [Soboliphyme baturini]|uniref:Ovule protein n=1 Tax=Soboliphyme baturini TaxID=241478 RepID=A0A183IQE8_9BILA|nr:unnamed protein product [Soboliphyme baturini]